MPSRRRGLFAALLLVGLALVGGVVFAYGAAGLVLRLWRRRWPPALRALGIGATVVVVFYALAFAGVSVGCG